MCLEWAAGAHRRGGRRPGGFAFIGMFGVKTGTYCRVIVGAATGSNSGNNSSW